MKQTAVEWFAQKLSDQGIDYPLQEFEQAKAMEKEQKINFANKYADDVMGGCTLRAKEYYETFKSE